MSPESLLRYGFSVVPCHSRTGTDQDKEPRVMWKQYQTALPSLGTIRYWSKRWPLANWAILTGQLSGVIVLDIDSLRGFIEVISRGIPDTPIVKTRNGMHVYFQHPGYRIGSWTKENRPLPGCDFRGDGGYVIAPGSVHPSGFLYHCLVAFDAIPLAECPAWLLELCNRGVSACSCPVVASEGGATIEIPGDAAKYALGAMKQELKLLRATVKGGRDRQIFKTAATLFAYVAGGSLDESEVWGRIERAARSLNRWPEDPLTIEQIHRAMTSGRTAGMKTPRTITTITGE